MPYILIPCFVVVTRKVKSLKADFTLKSTMFPLYIDNNCSHEWMLTALDVILIDSVPLLFVLLAAIL